MRVQGAKKTPIASRPSLSGFNRHLPGDRLTSAGESLIMQRVSFFRLGAIAAIGCAFLPGQTVKTTTDEVLLDLIVRDKKGKPVTDLKPEDLTVLDNGVK